MFSDLLIIPLLVLVQFFLISYLIYFESVHVLFFVNEEFSEGTIEKCKGLFQKAKELPEGVYQG